MPAKKASLLGSRALDFWLVGGASLVVWGVLKLLAPMQAEYWAISRHVGNLAAFSSTAALLVNYPHFMVSYKLSYGQGRGFVARHCWQLIVVPLLLFTAMATSWYFMRNRDMSFIPLAQFDWSHGQSFGRKIMGSLVSLMYFTVGWHYAKQMFGIMMVYAKFDHYKLSNLQRNATKCGLFGVWFVNYVAFSGYGATHDYSGITYSDLAAPPWLKDVMWGFYIASIAAFLYLVVYKKYRDDGQKPSALFMLPMVSFAIWWIPSLVQNDFYMLLVPFFHSLQYLCFVRKSENVAFDEQMPANEMSSFASFSVYALGLVFAGWLAFEMIPSFLDNGKSGINIEGLGFFFICATLFINIHHYFIDNVLWRFQTSDVAKRLVK